MQIKIGDIVVCIAEHLRTETLEGTVADITNIDGSIYYRVISNLYDHWVHVSKVIKHKIFHKPFLSDESNTVIRHLDDLYK